jgi:hypothetical protein
MTKNELLDKLNRLVNLGYAVELAKNWNDNSDERLAIATVTNEIVIEMESLLQKVQAGEKLAEVVKQVEYGDHDENGDWYCSWCGGNVNGHFPNCPRQLALAAWDAAQNRTEEVKNG